MKKKKNTTYKVTNIKTTHSNWRSKTWMYKWNVLWIRSPNTKCFLPQWLENCTPNNNKFWTTPLRKLRNFLFWETKSKFLLNFSFGCSGKGLFVFRMTSYQIDKNYYQRKRTTKIIKGKQVGGSGRVW